MSDPYQVALTARAQRDIATLPPRIAPPVIEFVTRTLPTSPYRLSKPLRADLEGFRSARRGDYRVVFSIDGDKALILVARIAHRAHVYRS